MSIQAISWAIEQEIFPSSHKFILVALANFASDTGMAFPSIQTICGVTSQDRKTVIEGLSELVSSGVIVDTGKKTGNTHRVKVYKLPSHLWKTVPKTESFQKQCRNSVEIVSKQSRKRDSDPVTCNHEPIKGEGPPISIALRISYEKEFYEIKQQMKVIDDNYSGMQKWCADDIVKYSKLRSRYLELKPLIGRKI